MATRDNRYLRAAEKAIRDAEARSETYNGPCMTCAYYVPGLLGGTCSCPLVKLAAFSVTDAYAAKRVIECEYQRDTDTIHGPVICGPDGEFYKEAAVPVAWWPFLAVAALLAVITGCMVVA